MYDSTTPEVLIRILAELSLHDEFITTGTTQILETPARPGTGVVQSQFHLICFAQPHRRLNVGGYNIKSRVNLSPQILGFEGLCRSIFKPTVVVFA